jgi:hypothetical protein
MERNWANALAEKEREQQLKKQALLEMQRHSREERKRSGAERIKQTRGTQEVSGKQKAGFISLVKGVGFIHL